MFRIKALAISILAIGSLSALAAPPTVVIDPGHPAAPQDFGARGKKLTEIQVNFHVASLLAAELAHQGVHVILTKQDMRMMLTNQRRAQIAGWVKADLYIRLHCDETKGSGFTVVYPGAPGKAADGTKGPTQHIINASAIVAKKFHTAMVAAMKGELTDNGLKTDSQTTVGAKQGALTGSIYATTPTFLVDMAVLGNPKDETWLMNTKNFPKLVHALDSGVLAALDMG